MRTLGHAKGGGSTLLHLLGSKPGTHIQTAVAPRRREGLLRLRAAIQRTQQENTGKGQQV